MDIEPFALNRRRRLIALFPPMRLQDYVENFILYYKDKDKIMPRTISSSA
jgi:hypothetical protein